MNLYSAFSNPGWSWFRNPPTNPHDRWPTLGEVRADVMRIRPGQLVMMPPVDVSDANEDAFIEDLYLRARAGF
jgi:hypothetical protein